MKRFFLVACGSVLVASTAFAQTEPAATESTSSSATPLTTTTPAAAPVAASMPVAAPSASVVHDSARDAANLEGLLHELGDGEQCYRFWGGIMGLGLGAALIPAGIVMMTRDGPGGSHPTESEGSIVLGLGIGAALGGILTFILVRPMGSLLASYEERKAAGMPDDKNIAETEREWHDAAQSARTGRIIVGWLGIGVGIVAVGLGTTLAIVDPISDYPEQYTDATIFGVAGAASVILGLQMLLIYREPVEAGYMAYSRAKDTMPKLGFAPLQNGALVTWGARF